MKKEDIEKEKIRLELEKIKINHANELAYINRKTWLKITIIFGVLFLVFKYLFHKIPDGYLLPFISIFFIYSIMLLDVARYALKSSFYGKPKKWYDWIWYCIFLDFLFKRDDRGIIKNYDKKIEDLKRKLK